MIRVTTRLRRQAALLRHCAQAGGLISNGHEPRTIGLLVAFPGYCLSLLVGALGGGLAGGAMVALLPSRLGVTSPAGLFCRPRRRPWQPSSCLRGRCRWSPRSPPSLQAASKVGPAVVTVVNTLPPQRTLFGTTSQPEARGTGVVIDPQGYVVTNNHVVEGNQSLSVLLANGEKRDAKLVGTDELQRLGRAQDRR